MWSFPDHDFSKIKHCTSEHSSINSQHFWYIYAYVNEQNHKPRLSKSSYIWEEWVGCCICPPVTGREISQDLPELLMYLLLLAELWDWRRYSSSQGLFAVFFWYAYSSVTEVAKGKIILILLLDLQTLPLLYHR